MQSVITWDIINFNWLITSSNQSFTLIDALILSVLQDYKWIYHSTVRVYIYC